MSEKFFDLQRFAEINNYDSDTLVSGTSSKDTIYNYADNATINGGAGDDSIENYGEDVIISGDAGNDTISTPDLMSNVTVRGNAGNDVVNGSYMYSLLDGGADGDGIVVIGGIGNTIIGGEGNDTLGGSQYFLSSVSGGSGNDTILVIGYGNTISGGAGSDVIGNIPESMDSDFGDYTGNVYQYSSGDGNDRILGFNELDTLQIGDGTSTYSTVKSGNNIIVTVGKGKITLVGAASLSKVNIKGKKSTTLTVTNSDKSPVTVDSSIKIINASARTKAVKITGNALDNSIVGGTKGDSLVGGKGNDTLIGGKGNDTLKGGNGADIFVYSAGKDVITDYAEEDKISIASGTAQITTSGNNVVFNVGSGKITVKDAKGKVVKYLDKSGKELTYTGDNVKIDGSKITLTENYMEDSFNVADYGNYKTIDASAVPLDINITGNKLMNKITGGDGNDTLIGGLGNDTLTGGKGSDVFYYNSDDGNDVITDYEEDDTIKISGVAAKVSTKNDDVIFTVGSGKITVKGAKDKVISYADKNGEHTYPATVEIKSTAITLLDSYMKDSFDVADYGDKLKTINASKVNHSLTIKGNKLANKITGSGQDDSISGGAGADTILGGSGNDTIIGGAGNDSLKGGEGADVFVYKSGEGNDIITDYTEEDIIRIAKGTANITKSGKDVIFTVGTGKITVKDSADKVITYVDDKGFVNYYPALTAPYVIADTSIILSENYRNNSFNLADYDSSIKTVNASKVTRDIIITGNTSANLIIGGTKNNTIIGDAGNDTLYGGAGNNTFVYKQGDGNDLIIDYAAGDKISISSGTVSNRNVKDDNVIFTVGKGKITVQNGANKEITYIDSNGSQTYKASGNVAWFLADDDNFSNDIQLSDLVETKTYLPAAQDDFVDSFKENSFITYSDK